MKLHRNQVVCWVLKLGFQFGERSVCKVERTAFCFPTLLSDSGITLNQQQGHSLLRQTARFRHIRHQYVDGLFDRFAVMYFRTRRRMPVGGDLPVQGIDSLA